MGRSSVKETGLLKAFVLMCNKINSIYKAAFLRLILLKCSELRCLDVNLNARDMASCVQFVSRYILQRVLSE